MKHIELKSARISTTSKEGKKIVLEFNYLPQMVSITQSPLDGRSISSMDEMHKSNRLLDIFDKLDEKSTSIDLEDADYDMLCKKATAFRWPFADPVFEQFVNDIIGKESNA